MEEYRFALSAGFIALLAFYDIFNGRRIPVVILIAFFLAALSINLVGKDALFNNKMELAFGVGLFILSYSLQTSQNQVGKADVLAWGAFIVAFPELSFLVMAFLCSASFLALMVLFNMLFLKLGWNETIRRGVPYFPAMLIGAFASISSRWL